MGRKKKSDSAVRYALSLDARFIHLMQAYAFITNRKLSDLFAEALYKHFRKDVEHIASLPFVKEKIGDDVFVVDDSAIKDPEN